MGWFIKVFRRTRYFIQNGFRMKMFLKLKRIEEMVEVYYNSRGQFSYTLEHLTGEFATHMYLLNSWGNITKNTHFI